MTYEKSDFCCPETHKWFLQTLIKTCEKHKQILKRSSLNILVPYAQWAGYFHFKVPPPSLFFISSCFSFKGHRALLQVDQKMACTSGSFKSNSFGTSGSKET